MESKNGAATVAKWMGTVEEKTENYSAWRNLKMPGGTVV
jgi:hypothetical protein